MKVVNLRKNKYDVYIGRPSKWGNPFTMTDEKQRDNVVTKYELWLNTQPKLLKDLPELKDKVLGCFCSPKKCHGDVLVELANSKWIRNWFSNMKPLSVPIEYDGIVYRTVETFYQAQKIQPELRQKIADLPPYFAKTAIRDKENFPWRPEWNRDLSLEIMEMGIMHKFTKDPKWKSLLSLTEDWEIVEWNNWGDTFWGKDIKTQYGENQLGKLIMKVRNVVS